ASSEEIESKVSRLKKINLRKGEEVKDILNDIESELRLVREIIDFVSTEQAREYMGAKGVIYSYINRGLEGVSFLNPQTREKDIFVDYRKYFIDTLLQYNEEGKEGFKYYCFSCDNPIRNININMNLVKDTGFDRARKSSYVWNHE